MMRRRVLQGILLSWIVLSLAAGKSVLVPARAGRGSSPDGVARDILAATGVKGGLIVHLGCGDGKLTAALGKAGAGYLVQGLDTRAENVEQARGQIRAAGLYGRVSAERLAGTRLPYVENLARLVVVQDPGEVTPDEVMRVLAPDGVAYTRQGEKWAKGVKPRPKAIDEWTHYLHDSTGNAVSHDTVVDSPRHLQWQAGPKWSRHHDHMASMSALVSANGRVLYIMDEGPTSSIRLPAKWFLVARDAYSGVLLWKRPIATWNTHLWPLKSGPAQLPRRLVAVGDRVYVTLALDAPTTELDAATGETLRTYKGTANTEEIICSNGVLFLMVSETPSRWSEYRQTNTFVWDATTRANKDWPWDEKARWLMAIEAGSGKPLWKRQAPIAPLTLSANTERVCYHDGAKIISLDPKTGGEQWSSEPISRRSAIPVSFGPTLVLYEDVVLFAGGDRQMCGLSAKDGKKLWSAPHPRGGHLSPEDLLVVGGLAWSGQIAGNDDDGIFRGRDIHTGEVKVEFPPDVQTYWFHHRCYRAKATDRFLLTSRNGIEVIDPQTKHWEINHWVRGGCIYGIMPCNGMIYAPMQSCGCYLETKLFGLNALAPASPSRRVETPPDEARLERGPAYSEGPQTTDHRPQTADGGAEWATYRHDAARSGGTAMAVPADLKRVWQTDLGGKLSSVTVAEGKLFVASIDTHAVYALDAGSGKSVWSCTVGGRVDSPPTIHQGRALFGSADGWVYCLRAADGVLIWRFRVAPEDRRVVAYDQLESAWPVPGSVLVQGDAVYCAGGRSMFLDGGIRLVKLDVKTGKKLGESVLDERDPETGKDLQTHVKGLVMPMALPDVLSSDGKRVYMRSQVFDLDGKRPRVAPGEMADQEGDEAHLFCQIGFLDDTWFHRSYWEYGKSVNGGYGGWYTTGRFAPSGRMLVFDDKTVYGYGRKPEFYCNTSILEYELFAADRQPSNAAIKRLQVGTRDINQRSDRQGADASDWKLRALFPREKLSATRFQWNEDQPSLQVRALVLAGKTLFMAGPPDVVDEHEALRKPDDPTVQAKLERQAAALDGKLGSRLWAVSAADGKPLARYQMESMPVFDGMAAANGRLYFATTDGKVVCLGSDGKEPLKRGDSEPAQVLWADEAKEGAAGVLPPEVRKEGDFQRVIATAVAESKLGYRVRGEAEQQASLALKKLPAPAKGKVVIKGKLQVLDVNGRLINGFIAFGDGPSDDQTVKCGFRLRSGAALIVQGRLKGGKTAQKKVSAAAGEVIEVTITVDLAAGKVTMAAKGETLEATLERPMQSITFAGYCVDNAMVDFTPLEVTGE